MSMYAGQNPEAAKALNTVRVPDMEDPDEGESRSPDWWKARGKRRVAIRNARIMRAWLQAEDKSEEIKKQADIWGLDCNSIATIVRTLRNNPQFVPLQMRSQVEGVRLLQCERITRDAEAYRCEIEGQITDLETKRNAGTGWADMKMRSGSKEYVESVPIDQAILILHERLQESYKAEADALSQYMPKPDMRIQHEHSGQIKHDASEEFREIFARLEDHGRVVDTTAEVIETEDGGNDTEGEGL